MLEERPVTPFPKKNTTKKQKNMNREKREEILRKAGESIGLNVLSDETLNSIPKDDNGAIQVGNLYRRFVASQVLHFAARGSDPTDAYLQAVTGKTVTYMLNTLIDEYRAQRLMHDNGDMTNYRLRSRFFSRQTLLDIIKATYAEAVQTPRNRRSLQRLKRLTGKADESKNDCPELLQQLAWALRKAHRLAGKDRIQTPPLAWTRAYSQAGIYFTLRNLILFHACRLPGTGADDNQLAALAAMEDRDYSIALLLDTLQTNGIDLKAKLKEWSGAKALRQKAA